MAGMASLAARSLLQAGIRRAPHAHRLASSLRLPEAAFCAHARGLQTRHLRTSFPSLAVQQFKLADIGEGIAEVQLTEWFVKEGDQVKEMDNVCSVESDKASVELTSPFTGTVVKLHHKVQDTVKVGSVLIDVDTGSAGGAPAASPAATPPPAATPAATPAAAPASTASAAVQPFKLADIGEGIAEVQLTEWFVKEGDIVKEMDNLCSVESDKASVELSSPFSGKIVKIHYKVQDTVKVGSTLVDIETAGAPAASAPAATAAPAAPAPSAAPTPVTAAPAAAPATPAPTPSKGAAAPGVLATPKVRGLAKQMGVDLTKIKGTGANGRVLEEDLSGAAAEAPAKAAAPPAHQRVLEDSVIQITDNVGKGMVKSMQASLVVPYMALGEEIDMTEMLALQKQLKDYALKKHGTKVTVTSFMLKAISLALYDNPKVNSKFGSPEASPPSYTIFAKHNVSVAVDTPHGLMVPNIKDVGSLNVLEIQRELMRLAEAAQAGKLALNDIQGGTITLSNIGVIGTKDPRPILFDGQAVIGATGRTMVLPRYNSKMELVPRQVMNIRWVGDHRHLDGASLARFSNSFKQYMENPGEWCLTMR
ncbi:dbt-1 [Symbiodinium pilosum]|uniref:Dihydrolipoamide acetyltransferase component of pyruvate dehydrogenase complex n=1 Tax=Symbiodinium pilosum TaxID=2952 RepID=A0A812IUN0_SYMPI|nr:dbt-1 [Symbiodinium pilosum]